MLKDAAPFRGSDRHVGCCKSLYGFFYAVRKGIALNVEKKWQSGVRRVTDVFRRLTGAEAESLRSLCSMLMEQKESLQTLVAGVDAAIRCAECGGECCVKGRYHFTAVDLLVYLSTGLPLFEPLFENGLCPYLGQCGCLMEPAYRPFNCITFNCERIEDLLSPEEIARFYRLERELRESYAKIRSLFPAKEMDGALLSGAP